jgi:hypothetical protein
MFASKQRAGDRITSPLVFLVALVLLTFLADRLVGKGLAMVVQQSDFRLSRIYAGTAKADILVSGNSVANAMLIPTEVEAQLGRPVFSIASHGMDGLTQRAFIRDYLDQEKAPKLALIEIRPALIASPNAPAFSTYQALSPRIRKAVRDVEGASAIWANIFHTYRVNSPQLPGILWKTYDRDDQQTGPSNGRINATLIADWSGRKEKPKISPTQFAALLDSVQDLRRAGTRVVLVMAPIHPAARGNGNWIGMVDAAMKAHLPADVTYVDLARLLSDDIYFEDPIHLNQRGRRALQPTLIRLIDQQLL